MVFGETCQKEKKSLGSSPTQREAWNSIVVGGITAGYNASKRENKIITKVALELK